MTKKGGESAAAARKRKASRRQKRKFDKQTVHQYKRPPGSFHLVGETISLMRRHWKILGGIVIVYLILNVLFAGALSNISGAVANIRSNFQTAGAKHFADALSGFGSLVGSGGSSSSGTGSTLQALLIVLESLVIIWALRQLLAGQAIRVKQAYYSAMTPLVPFLLVIGMFIIQLLPLTVGSLIVATVMTSVFAASTAVTAITVALVLLLTGWSIYMLSGSIFALYIVTLPDMKPRDALRSAKNLVRFRRWSVIRRLLFLPLFLLVVMGAIIIPLILYVDFLVTPVFFTLSMLAILFVHTYLYSLYRGLLE